MVKIMADKEKLSALMDGESIDTALIAETEIDQESQQTWQNYHLIGDVMRGDTPNNLEWNIADGVMAALDNEPAHTKLDNVTDLHTAKIESQPTPVQAKRQLPAWLAQFGQVAMAACVSMVVILGVQQYSGSESNQANVAQIPVLQTVPFSGSVEPVSLTRESVHKGPSEANVQEQRRRINALLQDYELQLRLNSDTSVFDEHQESVIE